MQMSYFKFSMSYLNSLLLSKTIHSVYSNLIAISSSRNGSEIINNVDESVTTINKLALQI